MTTTVVKAIRSAAAWAADQTAMEALYGVGGYYTTLSAWEAAQNGDLVAADEIRVAVCYNDWPTGLVDSCVMAGWIVDGNRYPVITVAEGHRHNGTPGTGFWMRNSGSFVGVIQFELDHGLLEWVQCTGEGSNTYGIVSNTPSFVGVTRKFKNVLAKGGSSREAYRAFKSGFFESCLAYGGAAGFSGQNYGEAKFYNCVAANITGTGFYSGTAGTTNILKNCVAYNNTTNYSGPWSASSTNNASSSTSDDAPGGSSVWNITSADFVNAASNDFHLAASSALIGAGANLYVNATSVDIDGDQWPSGGAWDIGLDYYRAAAPVLSLPLATSITATSAVPQMTLTFT